MRIFWSRLAEKTYYDNLEYLDENWPLSVVHDLILEVEKTMIKLKKNPQMFTWWDRSRRIKVGNINKHISFFYSFTNEEIQLHFFWNNHQDPEKIRKFLRE